MLLCSRCTELSDGLPYDPRTLRFLEGAVWNEEPTVAEWARSALTTVDAEWARDTLAMFGD
jgi:hypothetical protein